MTITFEAQKNHVADFKEYQYMQNVSPRIHFNQLEDLSDLRASLAP